MGTDESLVNMPLTLHHLGVLIASGIVVRPIYHTQLLLNPNRLNVHKFPDSVLGEFAAMAGIFHATEWEPGI